MQAAKDLSLRKTCGGALTLIGPRVKCCTSRRGPHHRPPGASDSTMLGSPGGLGHLRTTPSEPPSLELDQRHQRGGEGLSVLTSPRAEVSGSSRSACRATRATPVPRPCKCFHARLPPLTAHRVCTAKTGSLHTGPGGAQTPDVAPADTLCGPRQACGNCGINTQGLLCVRLTALSAHGFSTSKSHAHATPTVDETPKSSLVERSHLEGGFGRPRR